MDADPGKGFFCIIAAVAAVLCLAGCLLVAYAVTAAIAEGTFLGLLFGGIACFVISFCCCVWVVFG